MAFQFNGGWKRDKPDPRDIIASYSKKRGVDVTDIDLRKTGLLPPVYDQGQTSSCTSQAIAGAIEYMRSKQTLPDFLPSRLFIYYNERDLEGDTAYDNGAEIRDGMKVIQQQGICPEQMWPFDPAAIAVKPSKEAYDYAIKNVIKSYERVLVDLRSIQAVLSRGIPVIFGIAVFENFLDDSVTRTGIVPMPAGNDIGGHAMLIVGAKGNNFIFRNSWGTQWGDAGYGYVPQAYILNTNLSGDFWAVDVA